MTDFPQEKLKQDCPHCDAKSFALEHPLKETNNFWIVCDVHPLIEGHVLIIPKKHISCVGTYPDKLLSEFKQLYQQFSKFIKRTYGKVSTFEHGKIGQTVFHSHIHLLPYSGSPEKIVPEDKSSLTEIKNLAQLKSAFKKEGKYLFFSIGKKLLLVDTQLGIPRFFRDRFATALGTPERGNWKQMRHNKKLMAEANTEIHLLKKRWQEYATKHFQETNINNVRRIAQELIHQNKKWHFHLLTPLCQLNQKHKHAFVLENIFDNEVLVAYSDKPQLKLGKKLLKLLHGIDVAKTKTSTKLSPDAQKILSRAQKLTQQGKLWHHHTLLPKCIFNSNPGKWVIIFEDQERKRIIKSITSNEPTADLQQIETLYYQQKSLA